MMSYGYEPSWSEGALKSPIFQTSTFVFESAAEGKEFFELAYGLRDREPGEALGLIYSRLNNPDLEILEDRLTLWEEAGSAVVFESGMAAISTVLLAFLEPGDVLVHSHPLYGGTEHLISHVLRRLGIQPVGFPAAGGTAALESAVEEARRRGPLKMIFVETPANPTNHLVDIRACARLAMAGAEPGTDSGSDPAGGGEPGGGAPAAAGGEGREDVGGADRPLVVVDNTFLGPVWQHPLEHGADLSLYSLTKYVGGHSDVIAGACLGSERLIRPIRGLRTFLGNMADPWTGWLLLRSLETLKLRMTAQMKNARYVADFLADHPRVRAVHYPGHLEEGDPQHAIYRRQCLAPGAMISFDVDGGQEKAFRFLDALRLFHLAVSLGGTESLAEHPGTMTHADVPPEERERMGIRPSLVRLSIGVEHYEDLLADVEQALEAI